MTLVSSLWVILSFISSPFNKEEQSKLEEGKEYPFTRRSRSKPRLSTRGKDSYFGTSVSFQSRVKMGPLYWMTSDYPFINRLGRKRFSFNENSLLIEKEPVITILLFLVETRGSITSLEIIFFDVTIKILYVLWKMWIDLRLRSQ